MISRPRFVAASRLRDVWPTPIAVSINASVPRTPTSSTNAATITSMIVKPSSWPGQRWWFILRLVGRSPSLHWSWWRRWTNVRARGATTAPIAVGQATADTGLIARERVRTYQLLDSEGRTGPRSRRRGLPRASAGSPRRRYPEPPGGWRRGNRRTSPRCESTADDQHDDQKLDQRETLLVHGSVIDRSARTLRRTSGRSANSR